MSALEDYSVNIYLRQSWLDPRLAFSSPDDTLQEIKMNEGHWNRLWLPDTYFRNEKEASWHDVTVANRLLRINASGYVRYVSKYASNIMTENMGKGRGREKIKFAHPHF